MKKQTIIIISLVLLLLTILILIYYYRSSERPLSKIIKISADDAIFWHSEEKDLADFHTLTIEDVKKLNELIKTTKVNPIVENDYITITLSLLEYNVADFEYYFILNKENTEDFRERQTYHFTVGKNTTILKVLRENKWLYFKTENSDFYNTVNEIAEPYMKEKLVYLHDNERIPETPSY